MLMKITPDEGTRILLSIPVDISAESIPLFASSGRVISDSIFAAQNIPPFHHSIYDGYALRSEDTNIAAIENPVLLTITEVIPAGSTSEQSIKPGIAAKILTGAPIPAGANAVVKYENTAFTDNAVKIFAPVKPGSGVVSPGAKVCSGGLIAPKGTIVTATLAGLLAEQGMALIDVHRQPSISIINTGSELTEIGRPLANAQIYNSNYYTLSSYLYQEGVIPVYGGIVPDNPEAIADTIRQELNNSEMVITTGGASGSDYDWALKASQLLGADILFWKIDMKPGGAMTAAVLDGKLILGLSGSPGAAVIGLLRIARPYIRKLCGRADIYPPIIETFLREPIKKGSSGVRILRGKLEIVGGKAYFSAEKKQDQGCIQPQTDFDLLGELPAGSPPLKAGEIIKSYLV